MKLLIDFFKNPMSVVEKGNGIAGDCGDEYH